ANRAGADDADIRNAVGHGSGPLPRRAVLRDGRQIDALVDVGIVIAVTLAGKSDQLPADQTAIAAIDGLAEHAFHDVAAHGLEELRTALDLGDLAAFERFQHRVLLLRREHREAL